MKRVFGALLMALFVVTGSGCTYLSNRGNDAKDIIDLGFTFSRTPQFAAYYDFVPIFPIGYGRVDGTFVGLGGGQFTAASPHYQKSSGLILWGEEELTFNHSFASLAEMEEAERNEEVNFQRTGVIGVVQGPFPSRDYLISCPHYLHLGWVGVVVTPRYLQMLDFVLGWTTIDIAGDDNRASE